jgi:hypothetical protein
MDVFFPNLQMPVAFSPLDYRKTIRNGHAYLSSPCYLYHSLYHRRKEIKESDLFKRHNTNGGKVKLKKLRSQLDLLCKLRKESIDVQNAVATSVPSGPPEDLLKM